MIKAFCCLCLAYTCVPCEKFTYALCKQISTNTRRASARITHVYTLCRLWLYRAVMALCLFIAIGTFFSLLPLQFSAQFFVYCCYFGDFHPNTHVSMFRLHKSQTLFFRCCCRCRCFSSLCILH